MLMAALGRKRPLAGDLNEWPLLGGRHPLANDRDGRISAVGQKVVPWPFFSAPHLPPRLARELFLAVLTHVLSLCGKSGTGLTRFDSPGASSAQPPRNPSFPDSDLVFPNTAGG